MASESITGLREQIFANSRLLIHPTTTVEDSIVPGAKARGDLDIVIFDADTASTRYIAALMVGLTPAIEGGEGGSPEAALRKLLVATTEILKEYIPKVGAHQRNIHGGGVFDEDMISAELRGAKIKSA